MIYSITPVTNGFILEIGNGNRWALGHTTEVFTERLVLLSRLSELFKSTDEKEQTDEA